MICIFTEIESELIPPVIIESSNNYGDGWMSVGLLEINRKKRLGQGGNAIVHEGRYKNEKVAVKRVQLVNLKSENREIEFLKRLNHPNVVQFKFVTEDENFRQAV